ncbi:hypothetical protein F183_A21280 [Bryobacterales bacterium F-183]|nr:hypothetical protein F183_A21280 [Bryobacterales bacterium F-183]
MADAVRSKATRFEDWFNSLAPVATQQELRKQKNIDVQKNYASIEVYMNRVRLALCLYRGERETGL